jgi:hypothetical protein
MTQEEKAKRYDEALERAKELHDNHIIKAVDWLKSIKPNHWKPSEEQMKNK